MVGTIPDSECLALPFVVVTAVGTINDERNVMKIGLGVDIACRSAHHAACADETGALLWSGQRFRTDVAELKALWARLPVEVEEVMVVMEPTRNAWVPLAAWFRRQGAVVVLVPSEQSSDLRDYLAKHTKTGRLDAEMLARLPVLHPEGLHLAKALGPGDPLKAAVKIRAGLVTGAPPPWPGSTACWRSAACTGPRASRSKRSFVGPGWPATR